MTKKDLAEIGIILGAWIVGIIDGLTMWRWYNWVITPIGLAIVILLNHKVKQMKG